MNLDFYYDIVCPYAYMASTRVQAMADTYGVELRWKPILLGGLFQHHKSASVPAASWALNKQLLGLKDIHRSAERLALPMRLNSGHPRRSVQAMRLILATPEETRPALMADLFRAYHCQDADITDVQVLSTIAEAHGVDIGRIEIPQIKEELKDRTAEAARRGIFGVPTFELEGRRWWGSDRMHFAAGALSRTRVDPERSRAARTAKSMREIDFFHDFSSPFSYLASTQIERIAAPARVNWKPILLGALFRNIGTPDVPLMAMSEAKRQWIFQDLAEWAAWWKVDFTFPTVFPIRTVLPLRVALQAPEATTPLYRALWAQDRDIGQPEVVGDVLAEAGLDAETLIAGAQDTAIKEKLKAHTDEAQSAGVCGVPTFRVGSQIVWGQDRMHFVREMIDGWRPQGMS
jgi:2-hydroxychromene-2-carboxylate isomerase